MEIIQSNQRVLAPCCKCGNREMCQYITQDGLRWWCDSCYMKSKNPIDSVPKAPEKSVESNQDEPIGFIGKMTVVVSGRVYDLVERKESCDHREIKFYDQMAKKKSNFCNICGERLRRRHSKQRVKKKKV